MSSQKRRRKRNEDSREIHIETPSELRYVVDDLIPGESYSIRMIASTSLGRTYSSPEESILLRTAVVSSHKSTLEQIKDFIVQPWFLGVLGGLIFLLILLLLLCCVCRRSSKKKNVDDLPIEMQNTQTVRKPPR